MKTGEKNMIKLTVTVPEALEGVIQESIRDNYMASISEEIRRCLVKVYKEEGRIKQQMSA